MIARIVLAGVLAVSTAGCGSDERASGERTQVIAAFYPLAFAAARVGGSGVAVENLTPAGVEPHDLELSARAVERIRDAELVLYLGSGFQPALEDALADANGHAVDLLDEVELLDGGAAGTDPHVWLDPMRFALIVDRIGEELDRARPAAALVDRLGALDARFREGLADCERRQIVTSHAAFGYLADRYQLRQVAITGLSPEAEPRPRELERVIDEVAQTDATTIFFETLVSPRLAQTVARETGATTAVLNPLEGLTEEELTSGANYFTVMQSNLAALRAALGCR